MQTATARVPALPELVNDPALVTNASVTGVLVQFFSKNAELFPSRMNRLHGPNKSRDNNSSTQIVAETAEVSLGHILEDLAAAGFVLADGFSYERKPQSDSGFGKSSYVMRFQFHPAKTHRFESEGKKSGSRTS